MAESALLVVGKHNERYSALQVIDAIKRAKGLVTVAAQNLKCNPDTIRNYARRYPTVAQALRESRENVTDLAEARLYQAIDKGEPWAISLYLKTQGKERGYVETVNQQHSGSVGLFQVDIGGTGDTTG